MTRTLDLLDQFIDTGHMVSLYRDALSGVPIRGIAIKRRAKILLIARTGELGDYAGMSVVRVDDITRMKWGGISADHLRCVENVDNILTDIRRSLKLESLATAAFSIFGRYGRVTAYTEYLDTDESFEGRIVGLDGGVLCMAGLGPYSLDGQPHLAVRVTDVSRVDCDVVDRSVLLGARE